MSKTLGRRTPMDRAAQVALPVLTVTGNLLVSLKEPQLGLLVILASEPFWGYSGWIAWKKSGQIGMFITNCIISSIITFGVINYWLLN